MIRIFEHLIKNEICFVNNTLSGFTILVYEKYKLDLFKKEIK